MDTAWGTTIQPTVLALNMRLRAPQDMCRDPAYTVRGASDKRGPRSWGLKLLQRNEPGPGHSAQRPDGSQLHPAGEGLRGGLVWGSPWGAWSPGMARGWACGTQACEQTYAGESWRTQTGGAWERGAQIHLLPSRGGSSGHQIMP